MSTTGLVYDERMCAHKDQMSHPEDPARIKSIYAMLKDKGLAQRCTLVPAREITTAELKLIHDEKYLAKVNKIPTASRSDLTKLERSFNSIYLNNESLSSANLSCGSVVALCDEVASGRLSNGVAIVRPPGHHAESDQAMGFCLYNNVAVAAKAMQIKHGLRRILILDWDVHHGNATQHQFYSDSSVLYVSLHRYDRGTFYPGTKEADPSCVGEGTAEGKNINIAWNLTYREDDDTVGDDAYIYAFHKVLIPVLTEFDPELIIVSAGFDCAQGDPLGGVHVSPYAFSYMTNQLKKFANGKVVICLEGGYNLAAISKSMTACASALLGDIKTPTPETLNVHPNIIKTIDDTIINHIPHWKCFSRDSSKVKVAI